MLQLLFRLVLLGRVTSDFRKTAQRTSFLVIKPPHHAVHPDARAILADVPAPIACAAFSQRRLDFFFLLLVFAIFRREHNFARLANSFGSAPAEYALRASAPINDLVARVHHKDGVIASAIHHQSIAFFAFPPPRLGLFQIVDIRR